MTGAARPAEACALKFGELIIKDDYVVSRIIWQVSGGKRVSKLKTESSYRTIIMVSSIVTNEDVAGLFCTDANTQTAGQVLRDKKLKDVALVGFDLSQNGIELMKEGYIRVIIEQKPETFSYLAAKFLFQFISEGKRPPKIFHTPLYIMTSECLDD